MTWVGDYPEDTEVTIMFTTHAADGSPVAPSSAFEAADFKIYKDGDAAGKKATTNGVNISSPFDGITGLHRLRLDTWNDTGDTYFWMAGGKYTVVLSPDETVDGVVVLKVIAHFTIMVTAQSVISGVWDAQTGDHLVSGSFGNSIAGTGPSIHYKLDQLPLLDYIVDSIWDAEAAAHQGAGSFGHTIGDSAAGAGSAGIYGVVVNYAPASASAVAAEVWDMEAGDHQTAGSFGATVGNISAGEFSFSILAMAELIYNELLEPSGGGSPSAEVIANAVWDEVAAGHQTPGTFGQTLGDSAADASLYAYVQFVMGMITDVPNAVWDQDATTNQIAGSFGKAIGDPAADTNSIFKAVVTDATLATVGLDVAAIAAPTAAVIADAVWDEDATAHQTAGTFGKAIGDPDAGPLAPAGLIGITSGVYEAVQPEVMAAAVWDEDATAHQVTGTFGKAIGDPVADTNSIFKAVVTDATLATVGLDVAALPTANANADALLDRANGVETGLTPRQAMRLNSAALAGKVSGAGTATETIRNAVADSKARITATVDSSGNRTAITTDVT